MSAGNALCLGHQALPLLALFTLIDCTCSPSESAGKDAQGPHARSEPLRPLEVCNGSDDDRDGTVDEQCAPAGKVLWLRRVPHAIAGNGLAALSEGSVLVTGSFQGTAKFGVGEKLETTLQASSNDDIDCFVAKYDARGALVWAKRAGSVRSDKVDRSRRFRTAVRS